MKNKEILVSIITVCYNAAETIERTIQSVISQTYKHIEYIIVDGKSVDGTMEIIKKYSNRITRIISEPDDGIYDAMNKGIKASKGAYIGLLNADDWYEEDTIKKLIETAKGLPKEIGIISGQINLWRNDTLLGQSHNRDINLIWMEMPVAHPATFVKRDVYKKIGLFDTSFRIAADYDFIFRCYLGGVEIGYIDDVLTNFSVDGVSGLRKHKLFLEDVRVLNRHRNACYDDGLVDAAIVQKSKVVSFYMLNEEELQEIIGIDSVFIFGCGYWGKEICHILEKSGIKVVGYVDNDSRKWNTCIDGYTIWRPEMLATKECTVVIAIKKGGMEVKKQVEEIDKDLKCVILEDLFELAYKRCKDRL